MIKIIEAGSSQKVGGRDPKMPAAFLDHAFPLLIEKDLEAD